jgi:hypothetical protein
VGLARAPSSMHSSTERSVLICRPVFTKTLAATSIGANPFFSSFPVIPQISNLSRLVEVEIREIHIPFCRDVNSENVFSCWKSQSHGA